MPDGPGAPRVDTTVTLDTNERVLHLATARVSDPKTMDLAQIATGLEDSISRFYEDVLDEVLKRRFHRSLAEALTAVDQPDRRR
jgi:hypothetical protein